MMQCDIYALVVFYFQIVTTYHHQLYKNIHFTEEVFSNSVINLTIKQIQ